MKSPAESPRPIGRIRAARNKGLRTALELSQRVGLNVLPNHYFQSSVPDIRDLKRRTSWRAPRSMVGVRGTDLTAQLEWLSTLCTPEFRNVWSSRSLFREASEANGAVGFGEVECDVWFAFVANHRPGRIVQVGAGAATYVTVEAARFAGYQPEIVCVDPFPTDYLLAAARRGEIELLAEPAQEIDIAVLTGIAPNDVLFIDSTHTVKPGSEVNRIVLEVLPRLAGEAWVHYHDMFWPYDYTRGVLTEELFFWNESVLLLAYLTDNPHFEIAAALSMLHYGAKDELRSLLPTYRPQDDDEGLRPPGSGGHFPSSAYLRVRRG